MSIITAKFGGSSLADAAQFKKVADIIHNNPDRRFVVASAPGKRFSGDIKVTDMLYACYEAAAAGKDFSKDLQAIRARFADIIDELGVKMPLDQEIEIIQEHLSRNPEKDYMASRGEYLNSKLLAAYLGYDFVDPAQCVFFDENGIYDDEKTIPALNAVLREKDNAVIAGFYGCSFDGHIKTFSRGGSDITGSIVSQAVNADLYENWTDVSGMLAADPHIVENPRNIDVITYRELRILSYMGASVLHTDAVLPARKAGIPINIRNTNDPAHPGTMIVPHLPDGQIKRAVTGVAGRKGLATVQVEKAMVSDGAGFTAILLDIFRADGIPFEQCLTGIDTVSIVIRSDLFLPKKAIIMQKIKDELHPDTLHVEDRLCMIAVVGEKTADTKGVTVRMLKAVADAGIEIITINQGTGDLNLIIGVAEEDYAKAIRVIYDTMC